MANAFAAKRIRCNGILPGWMDTPGESVIQQKFHDVGEDWLAKAEAAQPMGQLVTLQVLVRPYISFAECRWLLGSGAPDRAAERRHKRDGSRDNNSRGYDGEQCR